MEEVVKKPSLGGKVSTVDPECGGGFLSLSRRLMDVEVGEETSCLERGRWEEVVVAGIGEVFLILMRRRKLLDEEEEEGEKPNY